MQSTFIALERKEKSWYPKLITNMMSLVRGCYLIILTVQSLEHEKLGHREG